MRVLIGIPSHRRPAGLAQLLDTLEHQEGLSDADIRVFVADNDARDQQAHHLCMVRQSTFSWPLSSAVVAERGISTVRNRILNEAKQIGADFVAMVDDDEFVQANWLSELLATQARYGADIVGGPVLYSFEHPLPHSIAASAAFPLKSRETGPIPFLDATGNVLLSCITLARLGWPSFDCEFGLTGGEDKEFFTRLRKGGCSFAWCETAVAHETVPAERIADGWVLRRAYRVGNADFRVLQRHATLVSRAGSLAKAILVLGSAPVFLPLLLIKGRRLWMMRKWWRAAGKVASAFGSRYAEYAAAG